jgi:hypothetical protein
LIQAQRFGAQITVPARCGRSGSTAATGS